MSDNSKIELTVRGLGFDLRLVPEKLGDPLRWRTPRMVSVTTPIALMRVSQNENTTGSIDPGLMKHRWSGPAAYCLYRSTTAAGRTFAESGLSPNSRFASR